MAITPKPVGEVSPPNSLSSESVNDPVAPVALSAESVVDPVAPVALSAESVGSPVAPVSLTSESVADPVAPVALSSQSASAPVAPVSLSAESVSDPVAPISLTAAVAAAIPRTLTPLVAIDFVLGCYANCGVPILFNDLFSYSRNGSATFINRRISCNGGYEYFLDTDYVGNVENLALYSEQIDNAVYTKTNTTVVTNDGEDENGDKIADRVYPTTTGTLRGIDQDITATTANHDTSFKLKAAGINWVKIFDAAGTNGAWFNISRGVIGTITGACVPSIRPLGNGYYRCAINDAGAVSGTLKLDLADTDNTITATANGTDGILVVGGQLTLGSKTLPYVKTITVAVTEAFTESLRIKYDPATGDELGALLEGAGENLFTKSEEYEHADWTKTDADITANDAMAPDDSYSADKFAADATSSIAPSLSQSITSVATEFYTTSFRIRKSEASFVQIAYTSGHVDNNPRANFDISSGALGTVDADIIATIKEDGKEYYRITATVIAVGTSLTPILYLMKAATDTRGQSNSWTIDDGVHLGGGQCENRDTASSYIRTEASTASRVKDELPFPVAGNVTPGDLTIIVEYGIDSLNSGGDDRYLYAISAVIPSSIALFVGTDARRRVKHGSVNQDNVSPSLSEELAMTFSNSSNLVNVYDDGTLDTSADAGINFVEDNELSIYLGSDASSGSQLFGCLKSVRIYQQDMTAQEVSLS